MYFSHSKTFYRFHCHSQPPKHHDQAEFHNQNLIFLSYKTKNQKNQLKQLLKLDLFANRKSLQAQTLVRPMHNQQLQRSSQFGYKHIYNLKLYKEFAIMQLFLDLLYKKMIDSLILRCILSYHNHLSNPESVGLIIIEAFLYSLNIVLKLHPQQRKPNMKHNLPDSLQKWQLCLSNLKIQEVFKLAKQHQCIIKQFEVFDAIEGWLNTINLLNQQNDLSLKHKMIILYQIRHCAIRFCCNCS